MKQVSELARQLYSAIIDRGYTSPDHAWEQYDILNELRIKNAASYQWLKELEEAGLIVRIPAHSITRGDSFYAVPPANCLPIMSSPPKSEEQREGAVKPGPARPVTADGDRAGKVGSAQALEEAVLLMLAEAAEDNISQLNPRDIAQRFRPPVPFRKVEIAADHLVELGYARAIEYEHATTDYRISQNGLKWVDENFDRTDNGRDSTSWKRRPAIAESADRADPVTASGIHIHNTFAPTNAFSPTNTVAPGVADTSGRSAARAGWANVWVALGIGAILIVIGLWTGGALK